MNVTCRNAFYGALIGLAVLKLTMLAALYARVEPHPPPAFAPLFGASLALSALAVALLAAGSRWFAAASVPVLLEALVSFGPHKFVIGQSVAIYPAVAVGSALTVVAMVAGWRLIRPASPARSPAPSVRRWSPPRPR